MKPSIWIILLVLSGLSLHLDLHAHTFENGRIEVYISIKSDLSDGKYVIEEEIVRFIDESLLTLDIADQEIRSGRINTTSNPIKEASLKAAQTGVKVRIILKTKYLTSTSDKFNTFVEFVNAENISGYVDKNPHTFHNNFIVRDKGQDRGAICRPAAMS